MINIDFEGSNGPNHDKSQKHFHGSVISIPKLQTKKVAKSSYIIQKPKPSFIFNPLKPKTEDLKKKLRRRAQFKGNPFLLPGNGIHKHSKEESEVIPGEEKGPKGRVVWFRREQNE